MKMIYVCSPYRGDVFNNEIYARECSREVVELGHVPIAPHLLLPQFVSEDNERELAIELNTRILESCDELWVFGGKITQGMQGEIDYALNHLSIKVKYMD